MPPSSTSVWGRYDAAIRQANQAYLDTIRLTAELRMADQKQIAYMRDCLHAIEERIEHHEKFLMDTPEAALEYAKTTARKALEYQGEEDRNA